MRTEGGVDRRDPERQGRTPAQDSRPTLHFLDLVRDTSRELVLVEMTGAALGCGRMAVTRKLEQRVRMREFGPAPTVGGSRQEAHDHEHSGETGEGQGQESLA